MDGWIKLHRKMIKWEWFTDVNTCHLFMYCILRANHTDEKWRGIEIKRGQFITSLDKLSSATGLSVRQIRTALNKLAMSNELTSKATNKNRLISVVNYESYQEVDKQATSKRQADDKQATTNKNEKNNKKEKELNNIGFLDEALWKDFLLMRVKMKKPMTDLAKERMIKKLTKLNENGMNINDLIRESTDKCWLDVYPDKKLSGSKQAIVNEKDFNEGLEGFSSECF